MTETDQKASDLAFPEGFLWGTATAAHQIEGGNVNNDWWEWEHNPNSGCAESSGDACDSFHRWSEDIELVAAMGLGAYRFSLEWSRIEPSEGEILDRRIGPLPPDVRGLPGSRNRSGRYLPPFHDSHVARTAGRMGGC